MRRLGSRLSRAIALALTAIAALSACAPAADPYAGQYFVKGGGVPFGVFQALSTEFIKRHPGVTFSFEDIGSAPGMALAASGDVDLALASTEPTGTVKTQVTLVPIGISGTAIMVNAANPVTNLTKAQLKAIFSGEIGDWSAVGGMSGRIFVGTRTPGSAIQKSLDTYLFGSATPLYTKDAFVLDDTTQTVKAVVSRHDAISIITSTDPNSADPRLRLLKLDGVAPSKENLTSGAYPMRRPLYLVYRSAGVKPGIRAFLDFVQSQDGQAIIATASSPT